MHKLWHVAKINFATCINIKTSIMDDGYFKKLFLVFTFWKCTNYAM